MVDKDQEIKKPNRNFMVACPNHDSPILQLPVSYRHDLLSDIIPDGELRERLFEEKANEWIFKKEPCTICNSIYDAVLDRVGSEMKVLSAVNARRRQFSRKLGTGISVFNTGDLPTEKATNNTTNTVINTISTILFNALSISLNIADPSTLLTNTQ